MTFMKRPSPDELLHGIVNALNTKVAPQLTDPYAQRELGNAVILLGYLREHFDTAVKDTLSEITELEALLASSVEVLRSAGEGELADRIMSLVLSRCDDFAVSALIARNDELQEKMLEVALLAERAVDEGGPLAELRHRIRANLRLLNERRSVLPPEPI